MFEDRIIKGIAWLDANRPSWEKKIFPAVLSMDDPCLCVLGQLEWSFWNVVYDWFSDPSGRPLSHGEAVRLGFAIEEDDPQQYIVLTNEWRQAIEQRRAQQ